MRCGKDIIRAGRDLRDAFATEANEMADFIKKALNLGRVDRRGFLKCMAWSGTGTLCILQGGVLKSFAMSKMPTSKMKVTMQAPKAPFDLNGHWKDSGREIIITHDVKAKTVHAEYVNDYDCRGKKTKIDFDASFTADNELEGMTNTCEWDDAHPDKNAIISEKLKLTVSGDGQTLEGQWFMSSKKIWQPVTIVRLKCAGVEDQLKAVANDPKQLLIKCKSLLDQGVSKECLQPYAFVADCFGPGAHFITLQQATGPGLIGYPLVLLGLSGPGSVPQVPVVSPDIYRDPMLITKDVSAALLFALRKAKEIMEATAIFHSDLGNQNQVIECVENLCNSRGWPTFFT
jgi:hypothetical protein